MTCENLTFWEEDDIAFEVDVTIEAGAAIAALTGGTVVVLARRNGTTVAGSGSVADATTLACSFAAGALAAGLYLLQVAVTVSGQRQTVVDATMEVRRSLPAP